jgi:hypothetical protein
MRLRRDSDDGSWRKRYKLLFGRVEDGGVPRGDLPPPVLFQIGLPAGRGLLARRPSLSRINLGKADRLLDGQRSPFDVCVTSVIKPREYYWKHASLASATVS